MTRTRSNVVPFERPASYWVVKARRHAAPSQLPNAARMMRKALEKSGDSRLALELSQIYARMHCYTASERYIMRVCAREGMTGTVAFLTGCAALNRGEEELGERALDLSLRLEPDGPCADQAQEILETYPWKPFSYRPRCARGEEYLRRSQASFAAGRHKEALANAKKAWQRAHIPDVALQLGSLLSPCRGLLYLDWAAKKKRNDLRAWLLLAATAYQAGEEKRADSALEKARGLCETITDAEAFCQTAWHTERNGQALTFVLEKLEKMPVSADYLRLKYLCQLLNGETYEADRTLDQVLEIDPDDVSALRCRRYPIRAELDPERVALLSVLGSLVYSAPERLKRGPLNRVLHMLVMTLDGVLSPEVIYCLTVPIWKKMTKAEKWACDEKRDPHYPMALTISLLLLTGHGEQARQYYEKARGKNRILRFLRRVSNLYMQYETPEKQADD